jgi:hypothetical protein
MLLNSRRPVNQPIPKKQWRAHRREAAKEEGIDVHVFLEK